MAKQAKTPSIRLSAPPPGMAFAEGGKVETPDELMARMAAKYGTTGAAQAAPVQQPAPQLQQNSQGRPEQQGITTGVIPPEISGS